MESISRSRRIDFQIAKFRESDKDSTRLVGLYSSEIRRLIRRNKDLEISITAKYIYPNGDEKFACLICYK